MRGRRRARIVAGSYVLLGRSDAGGLGSSALLVRLVGLEPTRIAPPAPQAGVSTNSTTAAFKSCNTFSAAITAAAVAPSEHRWTHCSPAPGAPRRVDHFHSLPAPAASSPRA